MNDEPVAAKTESPSRLALIALCFALAIAVIGLAYTATVKQPSNRVITGNLSVSYMLITSKTATSEEASGSTIDASSVEYFPTYVLVTTRDEATVLWQIDRLKKLEVLRVDAAKTSRVQTNVTE